VAHNLLTLLHHELKKLRTIANALHPGPGKEEFAPKPDTASLQSEITSECDTLREKLTSVLFSDAREEVLERFIRYHQTGLIEIADQLNTLLAVQDDTELTAITNGFMSLVISLLDYIERYFSRYFNPDEKIPDAYRSLVLKEISGAIDRLRRSVTMKISSEGLRKCIFDYLSTFTGDLFPPDLSFRNLIYLKGFVTELNELLQREEVGQWDLRVSLSLIYLNFNHLGFLVYCQDSIKSELDDTGTKEQYGQVLTRYLSLVKSQQCKPSFSYHSLWPDIRVMLQTWLNDEIAAAAKTTSAEREMPATAEEKILLNMPVAQIALLIRLLHEEGCFANASVTDILRLTARYYRSKRQENISPGSLGKEYYSVNQVTAAVMRDMLQKMTVRINKNYFPV